MRSMLASGKGRAADAALLAVHGLDQVDQCCPRHDAVHLLEKLALARALGGQIQSQIGLLHRFTPALDGVRASTSGLRHRWTGFAEFP
jgi:hypothetical protein